MRVAPLGAYYFGNPARAAAEAAAQAEVTHANIEGIAGAIAVAVAASTPQTGRALFDAVLDLTPGTYVRKGLRRARTLSGSTIEQAAAVLGNGSRISAQDTVPFALWATARYHATTRPPSAPACGQAATWTPPPPSQAGSSPPRPARKEYQAPGS
jgi:ADP-ribosylglycohydrolase